MKFSKGLLNYWKAIDTNTSLSVIVSEKELSLARLKKEQSDTKVNALLVFAVADLVNSFNVGKSMNEAQIEFAVEVIKTDYYFLSMSELKYCFTKAKKGLYGAMFDRIDTATIVSWLELFCQERLQIIEDRRLEESKMYKRDFVKDVHPTILTAMKKVVEKYEVEKKEDILSKELVAPIIRIKSDMELLCQSWFRKFDKYDMVQNNDNINSVRIIILKEKQYTQNDYLTYRMSKCKLTKKTNEKNESESSSQQTK